MKGIYRHKKTGAEQILSDRTVEILNERDVWEFIEEFNPSDEQNLVTIIDKENPSNILGRFTQPPIREILPKTEPLNNSDDDNSDDYQEEGVVTGVLSETAPKVVPKVNKGGRPKKVVTLEDLNK